MNNLNIALIFSGGVGTRMNLEDKPKQFLELNGKTILAYTLEHFQNHSDIDAIVVVMHHNWIDHTNNLITKHGFDKVKSVVAGGAFGQLSIFNGLLEIEKNYPSNSIVLIHDGVRPLINAEIISDNINQVKISGSAITTSPTIETFVVTDDALLVQDVPKRKNSRLAKAPQSFILKDIISTHRHALKDNLKDSIDSCTLMNQYGYSLTLVEGPIENIKITTPTDYFIFKAIVESKQSNKKPGD